MVNIKRSELKKLAIDNFGNDSLENQQRIAVMIGVARAARTSYTTVGEDGKEIPYEKDIALHDSLLTSGHFSPFEHCSRAMSDEEYNSYTKTYPEKNNIQGKIEKGWCLNYRGFIQYRYLLQNQ